MDEQKWWQLRWVQVTIVLVIAGLVYGIVLSLPSHNQPPPQANQGQGSQANQGQQSSNSGPPPVDPQPDPTEPINILVLGADKVEQTPSGGTVPSRSDTMMLVSVDPLRDKISIVSIPRDTYVGHIPTVKNPTGQGNMKINAAYANGGVDLAIREVKHFFHVPIHYYVVVDLQGFAAAIDQLGGVTIDVKERMYYVDPYQNLTIDIKPGVQHMDGETALHYVRFRHDSQGDIGRIKRQQEFIQALMAQKLKPQYITKLPALVNTYLKYVATNMGPSQIIHFADIAWQMKQSGQGIQTATLPGKNGTVKGDPYHLDYWLLNMKKSQQILDEYVRGVDRQYNSKVTVKVLNASGVSGAGQKMAAFLKNRGYQVTDTTTSSTPRDHTEVINYTSDNKEGQFVARAVMQAIQTATYGRVDRSSDSSQKQADITVIVGQDYSQSDLASNSSS